MPTQMIDRTKLKERMIAVHRKLTARGVNPTLPVLAASLRIGAGLCGRVRGELVRDGELVLPAPLRRKRPDLDDPFTEKPDDPDADEIRARVAEVAKRHSSYNKVAARRDYVRVAHHCELPSYLPRSRQRVTA
jgi:hypothetical protein